MIRLNEKQIKNYINLFEEDSIIKKLTKYLKEGYIFGLELIGDGSSESKTEMFYLGVYDTEEDFENDDAYYVDELSLKGFLEILDITV